MCVRARAAHTHPRTRRAHARARAYARAHTKARTRTRTHTRARTRTRARTHTHSQDGLYEGLCAVRAELAALDRRREVQSKQTQSKIHNKQTQVFIRFITNKPPAPSSPPSTAAARFTKQTHSIVTSLNTRSNTNSFKTSISVASPHLQPYPRHAHAELAANGRRRKVTAGAAPPDNGMTPFQVCSRPSSGAARCQMKRRLFKFATAPRVRIHLLLVQRREVPDEKTPFQVCNRPSCPHPSSSCPAPRGAR